MMKPPLRQTLLLILAAGLFFTLLLTPHTAVAAPVLQETCEMPFEPVSAPLDDLAGLEYIRMDGTPTGAFGGLYPNGSNTRPAGHEAAGLRISRQVVPRDSAGNIDALNGVIVMVSIGMSNTAMEFMTFRDAAQADPHVNPSLVLVNGAQPGQTSEAWVDPEAPPWVELNNRLQHAGLSNAQVQVAWLKQTQTGHGSFPDKPRSLQEELKVIVHNLKTHYPNLQLVYLSSRTRSYTSYIGLSPEPSAFETGFAVKWLVQAQIEGDPELNYDAAKGPVVAPYLAWGPYLWADGLNPRSDGLTWRPEDMVRDCTHPSDQGRQVIAGLLMDFFKTDTTTTWFTGTRQTVPEPVFLPWMSRWN